MKKYDYHIVLTELLNLVEGEITLLNMARHSTSKMITTLSKKLGVSRPTIYLWLEKFDRDRELIEEGDTDKEYLRELEAKAEFLDRADSAIQIQYDISLLDAVKELDGFLKQAKNATTISTPNNSTTILIEELKTLYKNFAESPSVDNEWELSQTRLALSTACDDDPIIKEMLHASVSVSSYNGRINSPTGIRKKRLEKLPQVYLYLDAIGLIIKGKQ